MSFNILLGKTHVLVVLDCLNQHLNTGRRKHLKIQIIVKSFLKIFFHNSNEIMTPNLDHIFVLKKAIYWNQKIALDEVTQNFCFLYFSSVLQVLAKSLFLEEDWELGYLSHSATREAARIYHIYYWQSRFVSPLVNRKFGKVSKFLKMLCPWLSAKFSFVFYAFIESCNC